MNSKASNTRSPGLSSRVRRSKQKKVVLIKAGVCHGRIPHALLSLDANLSVKLYS